MGKTGARGPHLRWVFAAVALAASLSLPAAAAAEVYCVPDNTIHASCQTAKAGVQAALTDANNNPGADTVRLGAMTFDAPEQTGFVYPGSTDPVSIIGSGEGLTTIAMPAPMMAPAMFTIYVGLSIDGAPGSSLSGLTMTLPTPPGDAMNQQYRLLEANTAVDLTQITVTGPTAAHNAFGLGLGGGGTVSDATIDLPSTTVGTEAVKSLGNPDEDIVIEDSQIMASTPIAFSNSGAGALIVRRTTLEPQGSDGVQIEGGNARLENSLIDLGASNDVSAIEVANFNNGQAPMNVLADHLTIAGGGTNSFGVRAVADSTQDGEDSTVFLSNTVISGPSHPVAVVADQEDVASLTATYSNYDPAGNVVDSGTNGVASLVQTNQTNLPPGFLGGGDFHLTSGSALIDLGDPAAPAPADLDFDGDPRAILGAPGCTPRRDIGFDEFVPGSPVMPVCPQPSAASPTPVAAPGRAKCRKGFRRKTVKTKSGKKRKKCVRKKRRS